MKGRPGIFEILTPLVVIGLAGLIWSQKLGQHFENLTLDWRFQARAETDPPPDKRILVAGIGEEGLQNWGRWPWNRSVHGTLLRLLTLRPPKVVAFDLLFSESSVDPTQSGPAAGDENDTYFADGLSLFPGAITGASAEQALQGPTYEESAIGNTQALTQVTGDISQVLGHELGLLPIPIIRESSYTGFVNAEPAKEDGIVRRLPMVVRCGEHLFPGFSLLIVMRELRAGPDDLEVVLGKNIHIKGKEESLDIPIDEQGQLYVNYRANLSTFSEHSRTGSFVTYYSLAAKLQAYNLAQAEDPDTPWNAEGESFPSVKDQVLLVGQTASGLTDFGATPHNPRTPLVLVHANAVNSIFQQDFLHRVPVIPVGIAWLVLAWLTLWFLKHSPVWLAILAPVGVIAIYGIVSFQAFSKWSIVLPLFWPAVGFFGVHIVSVVHRLLQEMRAKSKIKGIFGTYVSPEVVDQIVASGEDPKLGGESCEISAFFSDIQGFSAFSEMLTAEKLVSLMIDYHSEMTDILHYHGGTLDKYIGDAIVGMFGAPLPYPDHAYRACQTCVEMQKRQAELREHWRSQGTWPDVVYEMQTRIGVNSGSAVIGNMGSRKRFNYTMMGDSVNLAARCESGAKSFGVYSMVTEDTMRLSERDHPGQILFRYLDKIVVKGRTQPVGMYEVVGVKNDLTPAVQDCLDLFGQAIAKYLKQDWDGAAELFQKSAGFEPNQPGKVPGVATNPSLLMTKRCSHMKANPPGEDWDGVYVMESK